MPATAMAFSAQSRALDINAGREAGGWPGVGGGSCWAREMERLFTGLLVWYGIMGREGDELRTAVWQLDEGDRAKAWRNRGAAR